MATSKVVKQYGKTANPSPDAMLGTQPFYINPANKPVPTPPPDAMMGTQGFNIPKDSPYYKAPQQSSSGPGLIPKISDFVRSNVKAPFKFTVGPGGPFKQGGTIPNNAVTGQPVDPTQYTKTLDDFLAKARSMLSADAYAKVSAQISAIAAKETALQNQAAASNANIGSGYSALGKFINGQAAPLAQNYDTATTGVTQAQADAQKSITDSNAAAEAQQQAIMKMIGIGDTNIVLQNKGVTNSAQTAANVANSALSGQFSRTQLASNKGTALTQNTNSGTAAALEGRSAQDSIQKQLATYLAQLEDQKSTAQASGGVSEADVNSLAQSMMNQDMSQFGANYDRSYQVQKDALAAAKSMNDANSTPVDTSAATIGILGSISANLQNSGLDGPTSQNVVTAIQNLYNNNGGPIADPTAFAKAVSDSMAGTVDPVDISNAVYAFLKYVG